MIYILFAFCWPAILVVLFFWIPAYLSLVDFRKEIGIGIVIQAVIIIYLNLYEYTMYGLFPLLGAQLIGLIVFYWYLLFRLKTMIHD